MLFMLKLIVAMAPLLVSGMDVPNPAVTEHGSGKNAALIARLNEKMIEGSVTDAAKESELDDDVYEDGYPEDSEIDTKREQLTSSIFRLVLQLAAKESEHQCEDGCEHAAPELDDVLRMIREGAYPEENQEIDAKKEELTPPSAAEITQEQQKKALQQWVQENPEEARALVVCGCGGDNRCGNCSKIARKCLKCCGITVGVAVAAASVVAVTKCLVCFCAIYGPGVGQCCSNVLCCSNATGCCGVEHAYNLCQACSGCGNTCNCANCCMYAGTNVWSWLTSCNWSWTAVAL